MAIETTRRLVPGAEIVGCTTVETTPVRPDEFTKWRVSLKIEPTNQMVVSEIRVLVRYLATVADVLEEMGDKP